jgi:hypothetical protein
LVLVTTNARISRPRGELPGHDTIIKSDQIKARVDTDIDADNNPLQMAKLIGADTLQEFAQRLAEEHRPIEFDWAGRFGLPLKPPVNVARPMTSAGSNRPAAAPAMSPHDGARVSAVEVVGEKKSKLVCAGCGSSVAYNVAKFCWFNKPRFGGLVYCIDCQKNVPKPA